MTSSSDLESILGEGMFDHASALPPATSVEQLAEENIRLNYLARTRLRVLDATTEGIYQIDSDGRCTFMNRGACRMLGYRFGQAIGTRLLELHHDQFDSLGTLAEQLVSEESVEDVLRRTDGMRFPVEFCCHPIWANGIHQGTVVVFRDITERKRIERRLTAQHAVSRTLESLGSIEALTPLLLQSLGESLECCWGALWRVDEKNDILRLSDIWRSSLSGFESFEDVCRDTVFSRGQELLGRVWASAEPIWIHGLANDASIHCATAVQAGFRSGFALPIRLTQGVFGVMEFLTRTHAPLDSDLLGILGLIGSGVGQVIERKRSESVRARLAAILEATADFAGIVIDSAGTILSVSRAVERIFGFSPTELIDRPLTVLIPEYRHYLQQNGGPNSLDPGGFQPCCIRMPGRHRSGESVPVEVCLGECIENGSRVISGIIRDDTARTVSEEVLGRQAEDLRRSEEALRHQTRLVTSIISSMADGVIAADENGEIMLFNPAAERLVGNQIPSAFLSAGTQVDLGYTPFLPDKRTPFPSDEMPLRRAVQGETVSGLELFIRTTRRPDGFWLNQTARPIIDNQGLLRGGVLVCRDVSEQKASREALRRAKDEAEAANRAKSEFLSRMSHELRTPMNAILGFAQLLEAEALTTEQLDGVLRILKASRHLLGLINEVLDISRIEAGSLNLQMEILQPFHVIQAAIELIAPLAAQRQIEVVPPPPSDSHWTINADRQRLTQVFVNLLGNAVKYNREQGQIRVSLEKTQEQLLRINIADTGNGLTPEQVKKLFVPFERLGAERSGIEGTGIGLAYSNCLVVAMGGKIGVESEVGEGSLFWIEIALGAPEQHTRPDSAAGSGTDNNAESCAFGLAEVLCIQDDTISSQKIEEVFGRLPGYGLISAKRGDLGLQMAIKHAPQLVILDLNLPDIDGMEVLTELRSQSSTRQIPIVVVSATLTPEMKQCVLDAGAQSCLAKPLQVRSFLDAIACLI